MVLWRLGCHSMVLWKRAKASSFQRTLGGCLEVLKKCGLGGNVKYTEINFPGKIWLRNRGRQVQTDPQRGREPVAHGSLPWVLPPRELEVEG